MEEKARQKMQAEYDRLGQWISRLEEIRYAENSYGIDVTVAELDDAIRRGYKKLNKWGMRLGILEEMELPWFQFYEMITDSIQRYLPAKYHAYEVRIKMIETDGQKMDVFFLQKESSQALPELSIKEYTDRVADGADPERMLGKMADDYKKLIGREKKRQMER